MVPSVPEAKRSLPGMDLGPGRERPTLAARTKPALNLMPFGNSLIEFRPKSGCVASPLDGAGNRISRGLSQQARAPLRHPAPDSARPTRFPAAR